MSNALKSARRRWMEILVAFLCAIVVVNTPVLIVTFLGQHSESRAGQMARDTQVAKYPVTLKAYSWIESQGGLTADDVDCIQYVRHCPPRASSTP